MSDSQEMRRIMKLMEAASGPVELDMDFDQFESRLMRITADVARAWEDEASDGYKDRPAGPDTSKFTSRSYSMIKPLYNIQMNDGYQGMFTRKVMSFLQIGSGIQHSTRQAIVDSFKDEIFDNFGIDMSQNQRAVTSDGVKVYPIEKYGTSWGGIGFFKE